jgi:hypothetical protein
LDPRFVPGVEADDYLHPPLHHDEVIAPGQAAVDDQGRRQLNGKTPSRSSTRPDGARVWLVMLMEYR